MRSLYLVITLSLVFNNGSCKDDHRKKTVSDFNIIFTGNVNGEIEPCG